MSGTVDRLGGREATNEPPVERDTGVAGPSDRSADTDIPGEGRAVPAPADRRRAAATVAVLTAVVAVPVAIAALAVREPRWYPVVDLAQIELRVRDVGLDHPPLVGLGGRIFGRGTQGSHPGPLSFYALAPVYRLLGSSSWALQMSAAVLSVGALAGTLWATHRRWGLRGALLMAAGLAFLIRLYGLTVLLYPWNPHLPVLFWVLFLVCVWGVLSDDLVLLPLAVAAGCLCAQTHIPYAGIVGGMAVVLVAALLLSYRRQRADPRARRAIVRWAGASLALAVVLWAPVFVEQLGGDVGNLMIIIDNFRHPADPPIGFGGAWRLWLDHLNVVKLVEGDRILAGSAVPGLALLAAWLLAAAASLRLRRPTLVRLHVVVAAALLLGLVAISRIFGPPWYYLMLWAWGTAMVTLVAVVASAAAVASALVARRDSPAPLAGAPWVPAAALGVLVIVPTALSARAAPDTQDSDQELSNELGEVVGPTVEAIEDGTVAGGPDGTYLVTWADPVNLGGQGQGLLLELERHGYDARARGAMRLVVRDHRVAEASEVDAEIHLAVGPAAIEAARDTPGARQLAYVDRRTDAERAEWDRIRAEVVTGLEAAGLGDLVTQLDTNFFAVAGNPRVPDELGLHLFILGKMRWPLAVYASVPRGGGTRPGPEA
jgi:hypothetical protein